MSFVQEDVDPSQVVTLLGMFMLFALIPRQPVVYIPCDETATECDIDQLQAEGDLSGSYVARFNLYTAAWRKCLERIEHIVNSLHAPLVDEVVRCVHRAYDDVLPGLPYAELPVIAVSGTSTTQGFMSTLARQLETGQREDTEDVDSPPCSYITHLYPSDCLNIMSSMKALVTGFVDRPPEGQDIKRKAATSLANYDIELLKVWYDVLRDSAGLVLYLQASDSPLRNNVAQWVISPYVPQLSLVFVVALSLPNPSFLHATTRNIMVGPATLDFLADFTCRNSSSVEGVLLTLQLAHLKHFDEPLAIFVKDELLETGLRWGRLGHKRRCRLIDLYAEARADFRSHLFQSKLAFRMMRKVQRVMLDMGHRSAEIENTPLGMMSASLRGELMREGKYLGTMTKLVVLWAFSNQFVSSPIILRKLPREKLQTLLWELRSFFDELPGYLDEAREAHWRVATTVGLLEGGEGSNCALIAGEFGDWLTKYFQERIINLEDLRLGTSGIPARHHSLLRSGYFRPLSLSSRPSLTLQQMLNPAPRASIVSALLQPQTFLPVTHGNSTPQRLPIWKLPDVSVLFRRYLEAGRMINVYDWYESFSQVIESQRSHLAEDGGEGDSLDGEEWKMHVQARFMRALHTLDFIGLLRHTGRKVDHVMRTVFDMPE
ncbi:hypothetical protein B0F90DRAFT_1668657 [Multifurca ochricompacta]|uniref:Origin recognition complex subunit 3 n=1 Tax=Multifurca ochricompacta TaxID=376703 RepID=A0AAD4QMV0_9AGAM|nr:hypothetical protein B0F90DRAFT_1668657 [Multifurca ochricompacta]